MRDDYFYTYICITVSVIWPAIAVLIFNADPLKIVKVWIKTNLWISGFLLVGALASDDPAIGTEEEEYPEISYYLDSNTDGQLQLCKAGPCAPCYDPIGKVALICWAGLQMTEDAAIAYARGFREKELACPAPINNTTVF